MSKPDLSKLTPRDVEAVTSASECAALVTQIHDALALVNRQLEDAAARFNTEGIRSDPNWHNRARQARRHLGNLAQLAQRRLGELNRAEKAKRHREALAAGEAATGIAKRAAQFAADIFSQGEQAGAWAERERVTAALRQWADEAKSDDEETAIRRAAQRIEDEEHLS